VKADLEQAKYEKIWAIPEYQNHSPGEHYAKVFGEISDCKKGESVVDLGCGYGAGGRAIKERYGIRVTYLDLVKQNGLKPFIQQTLWYPLPVRNSRYDYGYCCDVMEHVPIEYVMLVLERIRVACQHIFFSVANVPDAFGKQIGEPLHLTVQPFEWWLDKMREIGEVQEARDLLVESLFYVRCR